MSEPAMLADHLDEQTDAILALWRAAALRVGDVPEAERLTYQEFIDHVPELLDRLAQRLRGRNVKPAAEGKKHGAHRWLQGYDIGAIVSEFGHLRTALSRSTLEYARTHGWDLTRLETALEAVDEVLSEATAESVRQFQEDSQAEAQQALGEIARRQRAAEEAREIARSEQAKLRALLGSLPVAVWVVDAAGTIIGANGVADAIHSAIDANYIGRANVRQLGPEYKLLRPDLSPFPSDELPLSRALRGETVIQEEVVWVIGGTPRVLLLNAAPLSNADGTLEGAVAVGQDVTERKRDEEELRRQRERALEASQHKTRLVSALSHDVRTPLNAVVLAAQLLEIHLEGGDASEADAEVHECLRTIRHSVRNVLDLLGDLLDLSKIDAGATPLEITEFPLEPVLAECLASIETQARLKGLDVGLEREIHAGATLATDRAKLKQIIGNFLSNAVRYTEHGQVRLGADLKGGQVEISVADTGVGIDPKDQERIFDEFAVLEHPRRSAGEGTGLGLAICRRLAGLLGGAITLASAPGQGSTFTLVLPDSVLARARSGPASGDAQATPPAEVGPLVVAEDHAESRKTLARVLRRMGYRVLEASDGREALHHVETERPLAVLMDVNMPTMDGVEATLALRADPRFRDLPIFALTGDVTLDNQQRIGEAGVNDYIEKPVTVDRLRQVLAPLGRQRRD
jgi:signal transduction histidine kinase/CheY-like chemotaxis protein